MAQLGAAARRRVPAHYGRARDEIEARLRAGPVLPPASAGLVTADGSPSVCCSCRAPTHAVGSFTPS